MKNSVFLFEKDLETYNMKDLLIIAKYYKIPTTLNKKRLIRQIALRHAGFNKMLTASMPSGENGQVLASLDKDMTRQVNDIMDLMAAKLNELVASHKTTIAILQQKTDATPESFKQVANSALTDYVNVSKSIQTCVSTNNVKQPNISALQFARPVQGLLPPQSQAAQPALLFPQMSQPQPSFPMQNTQPQSQALPSFPQAAQNQQPQRPLTFSQEQKPQQDKGLLFSQTTQPKPPIDSTDLFAKRQEPIKAKEFPPPSTCSSDEDCQSMRSKGELNEFFPTQKVICVKKSDGTPDCAYKA